jgi:hypothetical protein
MAWFHGPGNAFTEINAFGKDLFKGKVGYSMAGRAGCQDQGIQLFLLQILRDLLTGLLAAEEGMFGTIHDGWGLLRYGPESGSVDSFPDLATAADIDTCIF